MHDTSLVTQNVSRDPRLLAPTIAARPPPLTNELLKRKSRFTPVSGGSTLVGKESSEITLPKRPMQTCKQKGKAVTALCLWNIKS